MDGSNIDTKNFAVVVRGLRELDEDVLRGAERGMERGLLVAVGTAQTDYLSGPRPEKLDIVTRRLRDSIQSEVKRDERGVVGILGSNVVYAAYHEFGFIGTRADGSSVNYEGRPFARPAVRDELPTITRQVNREIQKEIKKRGGLS